jgi:hypothetical protein
MRFAVMVDLPFGGPKSFNAELLSGLPGTTLHALPPLPATLVDLSQRRALGE